MCGRRRRRRQPQVRDQVPNHVVGPQDRGLGGGERSLRTAHGASPATTIFLNVAMFRPEKNQRELVEIAAGLPIDLDWQLWLAGDGPARAA